jgi:protein-L-isoaspartate O-methyltransferase
MPFDVIVSAGATGPLPPTGTMQLFDSGMAVAPSAAVVQGQATITVSLDAEGQHTLTTSYSGDSSTIVRCQQPQ